MADSGMVKIEIPEEDIRRIVRETVIKMMFDNLDAVGQLPDEAQGEIAASSAASNESTAILTVYVSKDQYFGMGLSDCGSVLIRKAPR